MEDKTARKQETADGDVGYEIGQADAAARDAVTKVLDILRRLRRTGAETRGWAEHALNQLNEKLEVYNGLADRSAGSALLSDLMAWEGHILQVVRHYMQEAADTMNRIKILNPPLSAQQLRPFLQAVETDRALTIESLNPLTDAVEALARLKPAAETPAVRRKRA